MQVESHSPIRSEFRLMTAILLVGVSLTSAVVDAQEETLVLVGATIIDGNGGDPLADGTIIVQGNHIVKIGRKIEVDPPPGALVIDVSGKFITPGFIDTNVHISLYSGEETLAKYGARNHELAIEGAQMQLKFGVTTVRDSYGELGALIRARDAIAGGEAVGARMLVAGNIAGWGGTYSVSFGLRRETELSLFQELMNDRLTESSDEAWMDMYPEELRVAVNDYLDRGPDFIKYGGTSHWSYPTLIGFSPRQQLVIVQEAHKRGMVAETHATNPEGLRLALEAGVDLVQHPEVLANKELSDELVAMFRDRGVICSMLTNTFTGEAWLKHIEKVRAAEEEKETTDEQDKEGEETSLRVRRTVDREPTRAELRKKINRFGDWEMLRRNAKKLIDGGCIVTVGTDNYLGRAPEFSRTPKPLWQEPGIGTIIGIEGLVELGMSPVEAIVAATRNGARACKMEDELGTLEVGKLADLLILGADPLKDISNIRKLSMVMKEGVIVDTAALPTNPIFFIR